ncbi:MAG: DUF11 domain-containing protein [Chloroflexi bacterium]|nr:DUF11 domain-containing protein [Chloroflexota bacterium]
MQLKRTPVGAIVGVLTALTVWGLLNLATNAPVIAQEEEPTPTPLVTQTPAPTQVPTFSVSADVSFAVDGDINDDGLVNPGESLLYTITVTNTTAQGESGPVTVEFQFDPAFIRGVAAITEDGTSDEDAVAWTIPGLAAGASTTLSFTATLRRTFPPGRSQVTGVVIVRSQDVELARAATPSLEVVGPNLRLIEQNVELITDADENGRIDPGDTIRVTIAYSNTGGGVSQEASIVATFRQDLTREIVNNPDNAQIGPSNLTWQIGAVAPDGELRSTSVTIRLAQEFPAGVTDYELELSLRGGAAEDIQVLSIPVSGPNLVADLRFNLADENENGFADVGEALAFTLEYANVGTEAAGNVSITATYDPGQIDIAEPSEGVELDPDAGIILLNLEALGAGEVGTVQFNGVIRSLPIGASSIDLLTEIASDQTRPALDSEQVPVNAPTPTPEAEPTSSVISETRPAQGQGILSGTLVGVLIGLFLIFSLLAIVYVASRVLPSTPEERAQTDNLAERAAQRQLVREIVEGVTLMAILFAVMILGLQNALDQDSVNSIIAGIVGYVAGRVAGQVR